MTTEAAEEPFYMRAARSAVRHNVPSLPWVVEELLKRIDELDNSRNSVTNSATTCRHCGQRITQVPLNGVPVWLHTENENWTDECPRPTTYAQPAE